MDLEHGQKEELGINCDCCAAIKLTLFSTMKLTFFFSWKQKPEFQYKQRRWAQITTKSQ